VARVLPEWVNERGGRFHPGDRLTCPECHLDTMPVDLRASSRSGYFHGVFNTTRRPVSLRPATPAMMCARMCCR
jgi:hypothetical protein